MLDCAAISRPLRRTLIPKHGQKILMPGTGSLMKQSCSFMSLFQQALILLASLLIASCTDNSQQSNNELSFSGNTELHIEENTLNVTSVYASNIIGDTVNYSISGGLDASLFTIDTTTGVITFNTAADFETPVDSDQNNTYQIEVSASNGGTSQAVMLSIIIVDLNDNSPVFTSNNSVSLLEGTNNIFTVSATDADNNALSFSITGGSDQTLFSLDSSNNLSFINTPSYNPGGTNIYAVEISASDGDNLTSQTIAITIADINSNIPPVITSASNISIVENQTSVITVTATDSNPVTFSLTGGSDQNLFNINSSSGVLTLLTAANFEAPADADANNIYLLQVSASDGISSSSQNISISIINVNDIAPTFTTSSATTVVDGTTNDITVNAIDSEGDAVSYNLTGGVDAGLFSINSSTGAISFITPPSFALPTDADTNNIYNIQITASDVINSTNQQLAITVADASNLPPVINSSNTINLNENITGVVTVAATDNEDDEITYSITGGNDQALFSIDLNSGALSFSSAPDFETPQDNDTNNSYLVQVSASDVNNAGTQLITITINNINDNDPVFTSSAAPSVAENNTSVITLTATDADTNTVTFSITGGVDQALFSINPSSDILSFNSAPDFENPGDNNSDNDYLVQITASDSTNLVTQDLIISVTNETENANSPVFQSAASVSVDENVTGTILTVNATDADAGDTVSYSLTGGSDQNLFNINSGSGDLSFKASPDFENPQDGGTNNSYLLQVTASDTVNTTDQSITITVNNLNDNSPVFTSASSVNVAEGNTTVLTVNANDADIGDSVTYSISGGIDQGDFLINVNSGALNFNLTPDFANPVDDNGDNIYIIQITASDSTAGSSDTTQTINITVQPAAAFNGITLTRVFSSLSFTAPVLLLQHPTNTDRWYVVEKTGYIQTFLTNDGSATEFADLTGSVSTDPGSNSDERGLLGMTFHPNFASNNYVYVYYSTNAVPLRGSPSGTEAHDSVVVRYTATSATSLDLNSGVEIISIAQPWANHNGGHIVFSTDGYLYIGTGDGGDGGDPLDNAQNTSSLLGKMLRIDVDGASPYASPNDNPYVGIAGLDEIYAIGLRNPWRWSFDRTTGNLVAGDVGQNAWEEVDIIVNGGNYGWRCREGNNNYNTSGCNDTYTPPIFEYDHDMNTMPGGFSITGGYVYRGSNIPGLNGSYLFADYVAGRIWRLESPYGTPVFSDLSGSSTGLFISSFAEDANGEIYVIDLGGGTISRIDPAP
jgi:glucose/arabinose dehydrogenase